MKAIDWTNLYQKYKGLWVALKDDEITVIASGSELVKVKTQAAKKGFTDPIFYRVPARIVTTIG